MSSTTTNQDADARRLAARCLLQRPILTATRHAEELALVRRHATALKSMFATQLGYPLVVESNFARLVKAPLDEHAPVRPARRQTDDAAFGAGSYVHLALICAALLAPGVGEQVLISMLVEQIRADAAEQGIAITDTITDRRQLVAALGMLISWGVLTETDGSVSAWGERRQDEALLTVHRPLLAHLLPSPLHQYDSVAETWAETDTEQPRRRLRRRLVENPVVLRADLGADERDVLSRERTDLTRQLEESFGLTLEVRAEGALAYDASGGLSDVDFPGTGSLKQAALLLLDELIGGDQGGVSAAADSSDRFDAPICWQRVDMIVAELVQRYRKSWKNAYIDSAEHLREDIVSLLASLSLAEPTNAGLRVFPPAARYRPTVRAMPPTGQPSLFEANR